MTVSEDKSAELSQLLPLLQDAIDADNKSPEDVMQARVCQGWIYWTLGQSTLVLSHLQRDMLQRFVTQGQQGRLLSEWTRVCLIKGLFIIGTYDELLIATSD